MAVRREEISTGGWVFSRPMVYRRGGRSFCHQSGMDISLRLDLQGTRFSGIKMLNTVVPAF